MKCRHLAAFAAAALTLTGCGIAFTGPLDIPAGLAATTDRMRQAMRRMPISPSVPWDWKSRSLPRAASILVLPAVVRPPR